MVHLGPTNSTTETKREEDEEIFSADSISYRTREIFEGNFTFH